jgi:hypothetical protein
MIYPVPVPIVAKILNKSDILVKVLDHAGRPTYGHRRWGYHKPMGEASMDWMPIGMTLFPRQYISDFSFDVHNEMFSQDIVEVPFTYKRAE